MIEKIEVEGCLGSRMSRKLGVAPKCRVEFAIRAEMHGETQSAELFRIYSFIDKGELSPAPGASSGKDGRTTQLTLSNDPNEVVDDAFKMCRDRKIQEFFFSLDCHNRLERRGEYHSVLIVFHVRKEERGGAEVRLGTMEYGWDAASGTATVVPLLWNEPFWAAKYGDLLSRLERQCGRRGDMMVWGKPWDRRRVVLN